MRYSNVRSEIAPVRLHLRFYKTGAPECGDMLVMRQSCFVITT